MTAFDQSAPAQRNCDVSKPAFIPGFGCQKGSMSWLHDSLSALSETGPRERFRHWRPGGEAIGRRNPGQFPDEHSQPSWLGLKGAQ